MLFVDIAVILVGSAHMLWSPVRRKKPAVIFLVVLAGTLLGANLLPNARAVGVVKSTVVLVYLVGVIRYSHRLAGLSDAEANFDGRLRSLLAPALRAQAEWARSFGRSQMQEAESARARTRDACEEALTGISALEPPNGNWGQTQEALRAYLTALMVRATSDGGDADRDGTVMSNADIERLLQHSNRAWDRALGIGIGELNSKG